MSSIELLKEQARSFEQDEQWGKALDLYNEAIDQLSDDDTPDIALFNRSGDLATKIGRDAQALAFYERAVDYYMDAGLPNNAIAVCKKVMRNLPDRHGIHLKMGQIRAAQGFITDARTSFVTYAGKVQAAGDLDEAFRALIEFVNLAPDDHEICMMLAAQLEQNGRPDEAITQYIGAYRIMVRQGLDTLAEDVAAQIRKVDPDLDLDEAASDEVFEGRIRPDDDEESPEDAESPDERDEVDAIGPVDLPLMTFDDDDEVYDTETPEPIAATPEEAEGAEPAAPPEEEEEGAAPEFDITPPQDEEGVLEPAATTSEEEEEEAGPTSEEEEEEATPESDIAWPEDEEALEPAAATSEEGEEEGPEFYVAPPEEEGPPEPFDAIPAEESPLEALAAALEEATSAGAAEKAAEQAAAEEAEEADARAAEQVAAEDAAAKAAAEAATAVEERPHVSEVEPEPSTPTAPSTGEYVDIGAMLLGEGVKPEKSTRFVVPYEEPTGDDQADFDKMLAQFREKVSENIDADDATAHYDLGTAYMEMGLLDEAISEFQMVLRGTSDHLATYEMLGQTFLQKEEPDAALRSLNRGLEVPFEIEDERVGIYYYIGLAHERIGNKDTAVEFYDRVFAIDINFADVTERLRGLRN